MELKLITDLHLLFEMRLRRFVSMLEDADVQRIASSISLALYRRLRTSASDPGGGEELQLLSTQQVRILLSKASTIYSYDKAIRRVQHILKCGSTESDQSCYCSSRSTTCTNPPAASTASETEASVSRLHEEIDNFISIGRPKIRKIATEIMAWPRAPLHVDVNVSQSHEEQQKLDEVARQLLHCVADVVSYAEFDAVMQGSREDVQAQRVTALLASIRLPNQRSEERLRSWMCEIAASEDVPLALIASSLPSLRQLPLPRRGPPSSVRLSEAQIRCCLQGVAYTIRLRKVIKSLHIAAAVGERPSDALWMVMVRELQFAMAVTDYFDGYLTSSRRFRHAQLQPHQQQNVSDILEFTANLTDPNFRFSEGMQNREKFLEGSKFTPPEALRLIDLEATDKEGMVCLVDYKHANRSAGFTAVSHTFGMEVYEIFDCQCTARWVSGSYDMYSISSTVQVEPRWRVGACPHHEMVCSERKQTRDRVVGDILRMCAILQKAGARYAWHDGVCIAQHDDAEVRATIERIGWVYAYCTETVIFLHYVGRPMAMLSPGDLMMEESWPCDLNTLIPRWQQRAWTLQEAALARKRRYCLRVASSPLMVDVANSYSLEEFERMVEQWYDDDMSRIEVMDESMFIRMLIDVLRALHHLYCRFSTEFEAEYLRIEDVSDRVLVYPKICMDIKAHTWLEGLYQFHKCFVTISEFPTPAIALTTVSSRDSKHVGDRINSILALSGVTGFVAPKDHDMERSTVEFFKRQNQRGLQTALYAINQDDDAPGKRWMPCLLKYVYVSTYLMVSSHEERRHLVLNVLGNDKLELLGEMVCVTVNFRITDVDEEDGAQVSESDRVLAAAASKQLYACGTRLALLSTSTPPVDPATARDAWEDYMVAVQRHVSASTSTSCGPESALWRDYVDLYVGLYESIRRATYSMADYNLAMSESALHPKSVVERIGKEQETVISMELRPLSNTDFQAVWPSDPHCSFGTLRSPYILSRRGHGFSARLMWPLAAAMAAEDWPMLMVEGERDAVDKIGIFESNILFRACIRSLLVMPPPQPPTANPALRCNRLLIN